MKSIIFITLICLISIKISAQDVQSNITTPLGNSVDAWIIDEESSTRAATDNYYSQTRPNAIQFDTYDGYSSTNMFNCHSYAWYMSQKTPELTNPRWIGYYPGNTDEHIYWEDGSYIEVADETYPGMVSWSSGDHSAITTSTPGKWKSKWSYGPLCLHDWDDTPFLPLIFKYYAPFSVTSPDYVCYGNNAIFTTPDYENCTFNWSYSTNLLDYVSGQGTKTFKVKPKNSTTAGMGWVKLTLTINSPVSVTRVMTKNLGVNRPHYEDLELALLTTGGSPASYMCPDTHYHIFLNNSGGCSLSNYTWSIPSGWTKNYEWNNMVSVYTNSSPGGMVEVYADACNGINSKVIIDYFGGGNCGGGWYMMFSPNPTTGETTLAIKSENREKTLDETAEWELEIYSPAQVLTQKTTRLRGNSTTIQTAGWKEGVYTVRVKLTTNEKPDEILTGKLVVKK